MLFGEDPSFWVFEGEAYAVSLGDVEPIKITEVEVPVEDIPTNPTPTEFRTCVLCEHFYVYFGSETYSDITPGSPGEAECLEGVWSVGAYDMVSPFAYGTLNARICDKYQERDLKKLIADNLK